MSFNEYLLRLLWEGFCAEIRNMILYLPQTEDKEKKKALQQLKNTSVFQVRILPVQEPLFPGSNWEPETPPPLTQSLGALRGTYCCKPKEPTEYEYTLHPFVPGQTLCIPSHTKEGWLNGTRAAVL